MIQMYKSQDSKNDLLKGGLETLESQSSVVSSRRSSLEGMFGNEAKYMMSSFMEDEKKPR